MTHARRTVQKVHSFCSLVTWSKCIVQSLVPYLNVHSLNSSAFSRRPEIILGARLQEFIKGVPGTSEPFILCTYLKVQKSVKQAHNFSITFFLGFLELYVCTGACLRFLYYIKCDYKDVKDPRVFSGQPNHQDK